MSDYTFSCYNKVKRPRLKKRPWWDLFGEDSIEYEWVWERISFPLTEEQRKIFEMDPHLFYRAMAFKEIQCPQLEVGSPASEYISTRQGGDGEES